MDECTCCAHTVTELCGTGCNSKHLKYCNLYGSELRFAVLFKIEGKEPYYLKPPTEVPNSDIPWCWPTTNIKEACPMTLEDARRKMEAYRTKGIFEIVEIVEIW